MPGLVVGGIDLGIILQAQGKRIHADLVGQLVHRHFQRMHAVRSAGRAHIDGGVLIQAHQVVAQVHVVAGVQLAAPVNHHLHVILDARRFGDGFMPDRAQRAVAISTELEPLHRFRAVAEGEHLLPRQHHTHRAIQQDRGHHRQRQLVLRAQA